MKWNLPPLVVDGVNVSHLRGYVQSPRVARWKKVLGVLAVVYAVVPLDLIPDAIPLVGWLDDLGVLSLAFGLIARDMSRHAKQRDEVIDAR